MSAHTHSQRRRRIAGNLLLALLATVASLLLVEWVLHATHWFGARRSFARPDPLIQYRFQPNADYWFLKENDHPITGRINSHGWRDRERSLRKGPGVRRVAVLGDSYVEAFHVELDSTALALTESHLNRLADGSEVERRFEVLNFGRSGFTQSEEWLVLLHDIPAFDPDLVALFFYPGNDITDISPRTSPQLQRPFFLASDRGLILDTSFRDTRNYRLRTWINPLQRRSALISLIIARMVTSRRARQQAVGNVATPDSITGHRSLCTSTPDPQYVENYQLNKLLIQRMVEFCTAQDVDFLLVCMQDAYSPQWIDELRAIDPSFDPNFFEDDLHDFAAQLGVHFLGLQRLFATARRETGQKYNWVHYNYNGHRLVASALSAKLHEILVPPGANQ